MTREPPWYIDEVIGVLVERAPGLREALERALAEGAPYVILDGKIVDDRCHEKTLSRKGREIDLWSPGKKKDFGRIIQALFYPDGKPEGENLFRDSKIGAALRHPRPDIPRSTPRGCEARCSPRP